MIGGLVAFLALFVAFVVRVELVSRFLHRVLRGVALRSKSDPGMSWRWRYQVMNSMIDRYAEMVFKPWRPLRISEWTEKDPTA